MNVTTHLIARGAERVPMTPAALKKARARYWSNPKKYRAIARASYYRHIEKNRAAARRRAARKRQAK